jgi:hypothetical protein
MEKPSGGLESKSGQPSDVSLIAEDLEANQDTPTPCPDLLASDTKGSGLFGQVLDVSPKEERTSGEMEQLKQAAADAWS